jgi:hypothetical protein
MARQSSQETGFCELPNEKSSAVQPSATLTRRRFLAFSGTSLAASGSALPAVANTLAGSSNAMRGLMASDFRQALNTQFSAVPLSDPDAGVLNLKLAEVSAARFPHPSLDKSTAGEFAFSLKFSAAKSSLQQDSYAITHPVLGEFVALLVPTKSGTSLRAEFHRL